MWLLVRGLRPNNGQCQASPSMTAAHTPVPPPREGPYFSYKDVVHNKMSNTQLNLNLPDIRDQQGQAARSHLRVMPTSKQLTVINEIANTPARLPRESMAHIGQKCHVKSPQGGNTYDLPHTGEGAAAKTSNSRLPPLEKLLKRRGTVRKNNIYDS
ncbi:uncharacterized protein LOC124292044 [Haliotis rubra]|uniref:uncharacterized protein LOC124292044 n=1 Tax=Haliotis rubra TaxID=36100 RepID=UPI001EE4FF14|nr:uncharacterized protein LOC124292044 [Haliotis rubra]